MTAVTPYPLLDQACDAHGGLERWRALERIDLRLRVRPFLFLTRGLAPNELSLQAEVHTRQPRVVLRPFPAPGWTGTFEGDRVLIESEAGEVSTLEGARADASSRVRWSWLHALYFLGYAFWNYANTPFLLTRPGFEVKELAPWKQGTETLRRLWARFPPDLPTHSREQVFYFDERGWLRRLDYVAEVFSEWARGAHFCGRHRNFDGFVHPTHRVVRPRISTGVIVPGLKIIEGWIDDVKTLPALTGATPR